MSDHEHDTTSSIEHKSKACIQLKQFVDIITMNAVHHAKFEHAYVLDVHFSMVQQADNADDPDSVVTAAPAKRQRG